MTAKTSFSTHPNVAGAVAALAQELAPTKPTLVLYFASPQYAPERLAPAMAAAFPNATVCGCTTAGEIVTGAMLDHSIVAMAFGADLVRRAEAVIAHDIGREARASVKGAVKDLAAATGVDFRGFNNAWFGLVLTDGLSGAEERVMDALGDFVNIPFVGGSAGDDLRFRGTHVFAGAVAASNATVLVAVEAAVPFRIIKTQSFEVTDTVLVATKVDEAKRQVLEFNGEPATKAYAEAVGVPEDKLSTVFMSRPLGLVIDGEPFVRSPQRIEGTSVFFYCQILPGTDLHVLKARDIVKDTATALEPARGAKAIVNFHCILRTLELKDKAQCAAYGELFRAVPTIGFSTYGESYVGHINQTSTIVALG